MADMTYAHTPKPFGREVTFAIKGRELVVSDERKTLTAPLKEIMQMRLTYEPRNTMARGFRMKLWFSNSRTAAMTNLAWKSLIQVERQDDAYRRFVTALIAETAKANPACIFLAGLAKPLWGIFALSAGISMIGLIWLVVRAWLAGSTSLALLTIVFGAYFAFVLGDMIRRNRPRTFTAADIPADVLP